jgi:hypothetical protein
LPKLTDITQKLSVPRAGVSVAKSPTPPPGVSPINNLPKIRFEMQDRTLATPVCEIYVISFVEQEKHDRAKAEVERNVLANFRPRVTVDLQFFKSPPLDFAHPNDRAIEAATDALRIRPQNGIDHLRQVLQVRDVVDLRAVGHGTLLIVDVYAPRVRLVESSHECHTLHYFASTVLATISPNSSLGRAYSERGWVGIAMLALLVVRDQF